VSSSQVIAAPVLRRAPLSRIAALGSTATTSQPMPASQRASRPEPAPMSQASPGLH
jgi:hypothetical protein